MTPGLYLRKLTAMDLISLYDKMYTDFPERWVSPERNEFAYQALRKYGIPKTLLDVGCGSGHTIAYLKWRMYGTRFVGLDLSAEAVRLAQMRVPTATFVQGTLEDWETKDQQFDMILLMGVIEHFPDLSKALSKIQQLKSKLGCHPPVSNCWPARMSAFQPHRCPRRPGWWRT